MKRLIALAGCLGTAVAISAAAQSNPHGATGAARQSQQTSATAAAQPSAAAVSLVATEAVGKTVTDIAGDEIGTVERVVVEPGADEPVALITGDGLYGIGTAELQVPLSTLQLVDEELRVSLRRNDVIVRYGGTVGDIASRH